MSFTYVLVLPCVTHHISLNSSSRFCIIDDIPRADRVISSGNIISKYRIRAQISTISRRLQDILRICVRNLTFRRPHTCAVFAVLSHTFVARHFVTSPSNCNICLQNADIA